MNCVAIVLAAGASRRLGQPKQLLKYRGRTLIQCAVERAMVAGCERILVVTGAHADDVTRAAANVKGCQVVHNDDWKSGMGTSLAVGAKAAAALSPLPLTILLQVCDQPLIPASHLAALVHHCCAAEEIAATGYPNETVGVPAALPFSYCTRLRELTGSQGAKLLLNDSANRESLQVIPCSAALHDIDTADDLRILSSEQVGSTQTK
ncbi:MAG: nucleotidyltransferase family protein [Planctomycetota bacterium]